jgi:hypothetical protein
METVNNLTPEIRQKFKRLSLYYLRVANDLDRDAWAEALADLAELSGCCRRLWHEIAREPKNEKRENEGNVTDKNH